MEITVIAVCAFEGPNRYFRRPAVWACLCAPTIETTALRDQIKQAALTVGVVIGNLTVQRHTDGDTDRVEFCFTTPLPQLGAAVAQYVIERLRHQECDEDIWDGDALLMALQQQRRRAAIPFAMLQLMAEAQARRVPSLLQDDGTLCLGYGARSISIRPHAPTSHDGITVHRAESVVPPIDWDVLGLIDIIAVSGGDRRTEVAAAIHTELQSTGIIHTFVPDASSARIRAVLADDATTTAIFSLDPVTLGRCGLAFQECRYSVITDIPERTTQPDRSMIPRDIGISVLVTRADGRVFLNADTPELLSLARYAACPVTLVSTEGFTTVLRTHVAAGGTAYYLDGHTIVQMVGAAAIQRHTLDWSGIPWSARLFSYAVQEQINADRRALRTDHDRLRER